MGGNSSSSHVSYEDDHVTFVKGIRLTDKVINRMREECQAQKVVQPRSQQNGPASTLSTEPVVPVSTPAPTVDHLVSPSLFIPTAPPSPPVQPVKLTPPPPVTFVSAPCPPAVLPTPPCPPAALPTPPCPPAALPTPPCPPAALPTPPCPPAALPTPLSPPKESIVRAPAVEPIVPPLDTKVLPQGAEPILPLVPLEPIAPSLAPSPPIEEPVLLCTPTTEEPVVLPTLAEHIVPLVPIEPVVPPKPVKPVVLASPVVEPIVLPPVVESVVLHHPVEQVDPLTPDPSPVEAIVLPPVVVEEVATPTLVEPVVLPPVVESVTITTPLVVEEVVLPTRPPVAEPPPPPVLAPIPEPIMEELPPAPCPSMELATLPTASAASKQTDLPPPVEEPIAPPPPLSAPVEPMVSIPLLPLIENVAVVTPPVIPLQPPLVVDEEVLRRQIQAELTKGLEEEMKVKRQEFEKQLYEVKVQARAQAQIQEEVKKILDVEKAAQGENLMAAIEKERMTTEDERLMAQLYAHKLEEKENQVKKQDALFREQVAKLEEKSAQFFKVTTENFKKGREDAHNTFKRVDIKPVCGDLQSQILKCYRENTGQSLTCSGIANLYMKCVDNHKTKSVGG
nr:vegetative cell wall protein gp1-like isoform X4 [Oncorhynchus nerka]